MAFRNYLEGEDDAPYYKLNSLAHYYEEMERYAALIKEMTGYIKDYGNELGLTKEEIDQRVTAYILQNKAQLDQRLGEWDEKLQQFDGSVTDLLAEWVEDGTLTHIIDTTLIDEKIQPLTALLAEHENLIGWELQSKIRKVKPLITFTTDDGNMTDYTKLKPISEEKGVPFVSAIVTSSFNNSGQMKPTHIKELQALGWEMSSHTHNHKELHTLTREEIENEMRLSKEGLNAIGVDCTTLCIPYGKYNDTVIEVARKYFRGVRSSNEGINTSPIETFLLRSFVFAEDTVIDPASGFARNSLEYYKILVDDAVRSNGWLVFLTHSFYVNDLQLQHLRDLIDYIQSLNVDIVTLNEGLDAVGNIVDIGHHEKNKTEREHFVVGANGSISQTRKNSMFFNAKTNEFLNGNLPNDFPAGHIVVNKVQTNQGVGFPRGIGGTLTTDRIQIEDGWIYQTYRPYKTNEVYSRIANGNAWTEWDLMNKKYVKTIPADSVNASTGITSAFESGSITYCDILTATTGFPENKQGLLITENVMGSAGSVLQTYKIRLTGETYTRGHNGTTWTAWERNANIAVYLAQDAVSNSSLKTVYPQNKISYCVIGGGNSTGFPQDTAGTLITNCLRPDAGFVYQEFHMYNSGFVYKRYLDVANNWTAWVKINAA